MDRQPTSRKVRPGGFEPPTRGSEVRRFVSYENAGWPASGKPKLALGFSRDDAEASSSPVISRTASSHTIRSATVDQEGVGELMRMGGGTRPVARRRPDGRDLRRARRRPAVGAVLPRARPRLRLLLPLSRARRDWRRRRRLWATLAPDGTSSQAASRRTIRLRVVVLPAVRKPHGRMRSPPRRRAGKRASATSIRLVVSPPQHYERIRGCPSIREPRRT